jgi:hypothetical protein
MWRKLSLGWLFATLVITFAVRTYHAGVLPVGARSRLHPLPSDRAHWFERSAFGVQQLVLEGSPFGRGRLAGQYTQALLQRQEVELDARLTHLFPLPVTQQLLVISSIIWFKGLERYFEPWMVDEMYGVSLSAPHVFDRLVDPFTRQLAYHGLHELGQLMVDRGYDADADTSTNTAPDKGCTVAALETEGNWTLGRDFDLEAGRILDDEKVMKWVFPDQGRAFVSVVWSGMVGVVTGVNEDGLYLSLNAAGSDDFRRIGMPSTLIALKALQFASTAQQALQIITDSPMFITDIFVLLDAKSGELYRVEKSPERTVVLRESGSAVITNHLVDAAWAGDEQNESRKRRFTTLVREQRGKALLARLATGATGPNTGATVIDGILGILRDKGIDEHGQPLALGNRKAIDALIATHSVVFDGHEQVLYVSQGPAVSGPFSGFDLRASFAQRHPVLAARTLPADPQVTAESFAAVQAARQERRP